MLFLELGYDVPASEEMLLDDFRFLSEYSTMFAHNPVYEYPLREALLKCAEAILKKKPTPGNISRIRRALGTKPLNQLRVSDSLREIFLEATNITRVISILFSKNRHNIIKDPSYILDYSFYIIDPQGKRVDLNFKGDTPESLLEKMILNYWKNFPEEARQAFKNFGIVYVGKTGVSLTSDYKRGIARYLKANPDIKEVLERIIKGEVTGAEIQQTIQQAPQATRQQIYSLAAKHTDQKHQADNLNRQK